ncbi:MAG: hypothetical protein ACJARR_002036 [Pseudophaeobacter arcticus]|jgi:hypothetical protein
MKRSSPLHPARDQLALGLSSHPQQTAAMRAATAAKSRERSAGPAHLGEEPAVLPHDRFEPEVTDAARCMKGCLPKLVARNGLTPFRDNG